MKCKDAKELLLEHFLSEDQTDMLRAHAKKCGKCAGEIEGHLAAMKLYAATPVSPSPSFSDDVMEQVSQLRIKKTVSLENIIAAGLLVITLAAAGILYSFKEAVLTQMSQMIAASHVVGIIKALVMTCIHYMSLVMSIIKEVTWEMTMHPVILLTSYSILLVSLLLIFACTKPRLEKSRVMHR